MLSINTNLSSFVAQRSLANSTQLLNQAIERMTTGYKINHASDNSANFSISTNMSSKLSSYQVADDNASMGLDMLLTAEDTMDVFSNNLVRLRALTTQALNGTYGKSSLNAINSEVKALINEMYRVKNGTEYNGQQVFGSSDIDEQVCGAKGLEIKDNGFLQDIEIRDTSSMTKIESVSESETLKQGIYSISSAEELAKLARMQNAGKVEAGSEFVLGADIDLSEYSTGSGWVPIGGNNGYANPFKGTFDGNGHIISNLYINRSSACQGLFGYVNGAEFKNVGIVSGSIVNAGENTGSLVGALVSNGSVSNCFSKVDVISNGNNVGGLLGTLFGKMENCYATGEINAVTINKSKCGGLIGSASDAIISNCFATGDVSSQGYAVGGLVGFLKCGDVSNCFALGNIKASENIGGLCGETLEGSKLINSHATGDVVITGHESAGGLVGASYYSNEYVNCYANGNVHGVGIALGGFLGSLSGDGGVISITKCFSKGNVEGKSFGTGGFVGSIEDDLTLAITDSYSMGDVEGDTETGGLVGRLYSGTLAIDNSYSTGNVNGSGNYVGGIIGNGGSNKNITVNNSYSTGNITGTNYVGGVCGYSNNGSVAYTNCYSSGIVNGNGTYTGGFVGYAGSITLTGCYVLGVSENVKGAIAGYATGDIINCKYNSYYEDNGAKLVASGSAVLDECTITDGAEPFSYHNKNLSFQVGIDSESSSQISVNSDFELGNLRNIIYLGIENPKTLDLIDSLTTSFAEKQVQYGAVQNRLESALEEISIHYENLASSRSTLRDADIAKVSSEFIRQQILQQASATLLSTANQTPSIALQLL